MNMRITWRPSKNHLKILGPWLREHYFFRLFFISLQLLIVLYFSYIYIYVKYMCGSVKSTVLPTLTLGLGCDDHPSCESKTRMAAKMSSIIQIHRDSKQTTTNEFEQVHSKSSGFRRFIAIINKTKS
jgi:hypothetical protein